MATNAEESENEAENIKRDSRSETETEISGEIRLRRLLRIHRYAPVKWNHGKCHIHFWYFLVMILQAVKIGLITFQMIKFADDRASFSSVVNRGHLTLRHLLLKGWDSSKETPPYPPAQGDFAVYDIKNLLEELDYAVEAYYNIENNAIGFYKSYDNGKNNDGMKMRLKYFDFPGFENDTRGSGLVIKDKEIQVKDSIGLTSTVDPKTNKTIYKYNITEAFEDMNLTEPTKRMLSIDLVFSFHSVRVYTRLNSALCLFIEGTVSLSDEDNNGQMLVDLVTSSGRIPCSDINLSVPDVDLNTGYKQLGIVVIVLCTISLILSILCVVFGLYVFVITRKFMKMHYKNFYRDYNRTNLSTNEWVKCFTFFIWDVFVLSSDVLTILGTSIVVFESWTSDAMLAQFDVTAMLLSIGGLLSWLYILKIFKVHHKFHILFKILSAAFFPMMAYLICIAVLFIGFFLCGYVVLGPYHVKFATASATLETLFSISNGDEIFATLANVEQTKSGTRTLWWFSRVYVCSYVAIFTVVVLNILIAIFVGAHDTIKDDRQKYKDDLKFGSLEKALYNLLTTKDNQQSSILRSSLFGALEDGNNASPEIMKVKAELEKVWTITGRGHSKKISKPVEKTLKAFMVGNQDQDRNDGCSCKTGNFRLVIYIAPGDFL